MTVPMRFRQYIQVKKAGEECDPAIICPTEGYILPEDCPVPDPEIYCPANGYIPDEPGAGTWKLAAYFYTNSPDTKIFNPAITSTVGVDSDFAWVIDGNTYYRKGLADENLYLDGSTQLVELYVQDSCPDVQGILFNDDNIIGKVFLLGSVFDALTSVYLNDNPNLTGVVLPDTHNGTMRGIHIADSGLTGVLDLSMITYWDNYCQIIVEGNSALNNINFNPSAVTGKVKTLKFNECNLTGILDLSIFDKFELSASIYTYLNPNLTGVTFASSLSTPGSISQFYLHSCGFTGTLDLSMFTNFTTSGSIHLYNNENMTGVTFASSISGTISYLYIYNTGVTGTLDLSMFDTFSTSAMLYLYDNPDMTGITFASSITGTISRIYMYNTGLAGTLDLSMFTTFNATYATLNLYNNPDLTAITWAASISGTFGQFQLHNTGLTGALDLSKFDSFTAAATLNLYGDNLALTSLSLAGNITGIFGYSRFRNLDGLYISPLNFDTPMDRNYSRWYVDNNTWTAAQVNQFLVEMDTQTDGSYTSRSIDIRGDNAAPDGSSGGYDGLTAVANLQSKGITVYTN